MHLDSEIAFERLQGKPHLLAECCKTNLDSGGNSNEKQIRFIADQISFFFSLGYKTKYTGPISSSNSNRSSKREDAVFQWHTSRLPG